MKRIGLFLVTFFLLVTSSQSQTKVSGKVLSTNNIPLIGAAVYYNNTSIGTTTNDEGFFELPYNESYSEIIVSYLGFKTASLNLKKEDVFKKITFKLSPKNNMLDEVMIRNKKKYSKETRAYYLRRFKRNFIGKGNLSLKCVIQNPDVISFDYDPKSRVLEAYVSKPIKIKNPTLGYTIYYDLVHFEINNNKVYYLGYSRFEELKGSEKKKRKWEKERQIAFNGSKVHFLKSIYNNNLYEEGFEVDMMKRIPNPNRPAMKKFLKLELT